MSLTARDVRIYVPTRGEPAHQTVSALQRLRDAKPELVAIEYVPGRYNGVVTVRNVIVSRFLETGARVLVMLDDDMTPHPESLDALPALDRYGVLGWPAPTVRMAGDVCWSFAAIEGEPLAGIVPAAWVGTGCIAIRRDVLEVLGPRPFKQGETCFSETGEAYEHPSEDARFCADARSAGYEVGADVTRPADHLVEMWGIHLMGQMLRAPKGVPLPFEAFPPRGQFASAEAFVSSLAPTT